MSEQNVRQRLIEAAARLLDAEGAAALSTRRVAKETGVSTMAVYTYFGSMNELFKAIADEAFARFAQALTAVPTTDDPLADLTRQASAYRTFALANPHLYAVMFGGTFGPWQVEDSHIPNAAATFAVLEQAVTRVIGAGIFRPANPVDVAYFLWSTLHGFVLLELTGNLAKHPPTTPDHLWGQLLLTTGRGLLNDQRTTHPGSGEM